MTPIIRKRLKKKELEFQAKLAESGRVIEWSDVERRLSTGEGTLIVEAYFPKGPWRTWWTEDDLVELLPLPTPSCSEEKLEPEPQPLKDFASHCSKKYLSQDSGAAKLVRDWKYTKADESPHVITIAVFADDHREIYRGVLDHF